MWDRGGGGGGGVAGSETDTEEDRGRYGRCERDIKREVNRVRIRKRKSREMG